MNKKTLAGIIASLTIGIAAATSAAILTKNNKNEQKQEKQQDTHQIARQVYSEKLSKLTYDDAPEKRPNGARTIDDIANGMPGECTELTQYGIHELQKAGVNAYALDVPLSQFKHAKGASERHTVIGFDYKGRTIIIDLTAPIFDAPETKQFDFNQAKKLTQRELRALWLNNSATYLAQNNKLEESLDVYTESIELAPLAQTYHNRGTTHIRLGNIDLALNDFNSALQKDPNRSTTWYNIALLHSKQQKYTESEKAYINSIRLDQTNYLAWSGLGYVLIKQGKNKEAIPVLEQALKLNPDSKDAKNNLEYAKSKQ